MQESKHSDHTNEERSMRGRSFAVRSFDSTRKFLQGLIYIMLPNRQKNDIPVLHAATDNTYI